MELKFKGTKIKISFFFALGLCVVSLFDRTNIVGINLLCAALHECGHIAAMALSGERPKEICFTPFGLRIDRKEMNSVDFRKEALIALAGPMTNFFLALTAALIQKYSGANLSAFVAINIVLGTLNMAVCEPLDGYRAARYILMQKMSEEKTEKILKISSLVFLFPIAAAGFFVLIKSGYNFSLLLIACYLCAFLFFRTGAI